MPCWQKECEILYRSFIRAPVGTDSDRVASPLLFQLKQKKQERWEEAVNSIDFLHSSHKAWRTINKLMLQVSASPWTTEQDGYPGCLTNRNATSNNTDPSLISLYYYQVALSLHIDKWITIIHLWWLSQWLATYGHHLAVTIYLHVGPSSGRHITSLSISLKFYHLSFILSLSFLQVWPLPFGSRRCSTEDVTESADYARELFKPSKATVHNLRPSIMKFAAVHM